jgi:hypothetical protein
MVNPSAIVLADGGSAAEPASGESFLRSGTNGRGPGRISGEKVVISKRVFDVLFVERNRAGRRP